MDILKDNVNKTYFRFLLPTIGATLITSVYILADAIIIGRFINDKAMAALNVLTPIFSLFYGSGYLLGVGGAVLMAAAFCENKINTLLVEWSFCLWRKQNQKRSEIFYLCPFSFCPAFAYLCNFV